jgi:nucleotide-binding universal stress UspA family protein
MRASLERRLSMLMPGCTPEWLAGDSVHAGPVIARYVESLGGVSCHGYRGFDLRLGSVTEDLLARSRRLVVFGPAALPAKPPRVAVCLDGSPWAERAIPEAARWASGLHVPLWLVQGIGPRPCGDGQQQVETGYLHHVAERWRPTGLDLEWDVVHDLHVGRGLADWLNSEPATLTVAATHGRSGMKHGMLGGVAHHLVRHTRGPMVLQRPQ